MSRWVDADALPRHGQRGGLVHWKDIEDAPSIDLVFCKDCRWARPRTLKGETGYRCLFHHTLKAESGYCDVGERRENDEG